MIKVLIIGAGNRGMYTYGALSKKGVVPIKITGVAEPDKDKREKMRIEHNISESECYEKGVDALSAKKKFDAVIIATPDHRHYELTMMALKKGYHVLLEKPISHIPQQCIDIVKEQERSGRVLSLAHVLRYAPFFQEIKKIIENNRLGKLLFIDLLEEIGYWHYAHSYVRGNWNNESRSGPILLTKSCHDLDIINFLLDSSVKEVFSEGSLHYFNSEHAPNGSTSRCIENCSIKEKCPYNAERFYLFEKDIDKIKWPIEVISLDKSIVARKKALEHGPYGRCVFRCDNDVCDNQFVYLLYNNGVKVNFKISSLGNKPTRKIKIYFENGEVNGNLTEGSIRITEYAGLSEKDVINQEFVSYLGQHGGGDEFLMKNFVNLIDSRNEKLNLSSAQLSLDSHLVAFAAEKSRKEKAIIDYEEYKRGLGT